MQGSKFLRCLEWNYRGSSILWFVMQPLHTLPVMSAKFPLPQRAYLSTCKMGMATFPSHKCWAAMLGGFKLGDRGSAVGLEWFRIPLWHFQLRRIRWGHPPSLFFSINSGASLYCFRCAIYSISSSTAKHQGRLLCCRSLASANHNRSRSPPLKAVGVCPTNRQAPNLAFSAPATAAATS